jgi:hypothetical protein
MGWEMQSITANTLLGVERADRKDAYYVSRLKARWAEVKGRFNTELNPYIDAQNARFARITSYSSPVPVNGDRLVLKTSIANIVRDLDAVFGGY